MNNLNKNIRSELGELYIAVKLHKYGNCEDDDKSEAVYKMLDISGVAVLEHIE